MAAYFKATVGTFVLASPDVIAGTLSQRVIQHFAGDHQAQLKAWKEQIEILQTACRALLGRYPSVAAWGVLLEYPLLRLQRRLDTVTLAGQVVAVIEFKVGAGGYEAADIRQVEDYALDLHDFHWDSRSLTIVPVLCATEAPSEGFPPDGDWGTVWEVHRANANTLPDLFNKFALLPPERNAEQLGLDTWDASPYRPVPTIIHAAQLLFAGHQVEEITDAASDKETLASTANRVIEVIRYAKEKRRRVVCFVTGVPGSGKTLTGLNLVHDQRMRDEGLGGAAYLSGNTPLVEVLREALARDKARRSGETLRESRRVVRTDIQHLMDYLREYISEHPSNCPPEHVIIFDEAQRAWDADYGKQKFDREASEPTLFLDIMSRPQDWSVIVALVGGGQEINVGENGLAEWGKALNAVGQDQASPTWEVIAGPDAVFGGSSTVGRSLFEQGESYAGPIETDKRLHLPICVRTIRCSAVASWVDQVLAGNIEVAARLAGETPDFPIYLTRDLRIARAFLNTRCRGTRRVGLVASSGARRLRADGLGVSLSAKDKDAYVHWYLETKGDIRSSNALEVTANEYTCQGLELDHVGLCWGGDMLWGSAEHSWHYRELHGAKWKAVRDIKAQSYILNTYRVLMTRARLGMILWVPLGSPGDATREPTALDVTATLLKKAGARHVGEELEERSQLLPIDVRV